MDSRLRRFPPDRVSAVPYGQTVDNAMRCPPLAHRSAAAHKLHSAQANRYKIRESQNQNPGTGLSLFQPGGCPNDRDHRKVYPETRRQRCWFHKTGNVLNALPKSLQAKAKADLHEIWMAPTRAQAIAAFDHFVKTYGAKYPKATDKLTKDRDALLAFYDFPAEHWQHLRTTNPIESTFATVRHRTTRTKNCVSRSTFLGLAFKLVQEAEKSWRRIRGVERIGELLDGTVFRDGVPATEDKTDQQKLAA